MEIRFNKELLEKFLNDNKVTKKRFCEKCNVSTSTLNKYLKTSANGCRASIIYRICKYTGWEVNDFCIRKNK